jgi:DNA-binding MarR family transcriptional regulator
VSGDAPDGVVTPAQMEPATYVVDAVFRLARAVEQIGSLRLASWQMSLSGYAALQVMASQPNLSMAQVARRCFVRPQTMIRIVAALEQRGFVERQPNPDSERALALVVTPDGLAALAEMAAEVNKINATITRVLDAGEIASLDRMLRRCAVEVEAEIKTPT